MYIATPHEHRLPDMLPFQIPGRVLTPPFTCRVFFLEARFLPESSLHKMRRYSSFFRVFLRAEIDSFAAFSKKPQKTAKKRKAA